MSVSALASQPTATDRAATAPAPVSNALAAKASQTISTSDFLKLLSTEMASQDPMKPMDPTETMTQMAQFSTLQATNSLQMNTSLATANSFLGTTVSVPGIKGGAPITGVVTGIDGSQVASGGAPQLVIKGAANEYPITAVTQVTLTPPAPATTPVPSTTVPSTTTTTPSTVAAPTASSTKN